MDFPSTEKSIFVISLWFSENTPILWKVIFSYTNIFAMGGDIATYN